MTKRRTLLTASLAVALVSGIAVQQASRSAAADPAPGVCESTVALENGGFEQPADVTAFGILAPGRVPAWETTASDGRIEIWQAGYRGVPAAEGEQFAELAGNEPSEFYQEIATVPGELLTFRIFRRGRDGVDTMEVRIGPPAGPPSLTRRVSTGNTAWQEVQGRYLVPAGQTITRFGFAAISSASPLLSEGNFLDGVVFSASRCTVTVSKTLRPATDPGRVNLFVESFLALANAGDGATSPPLPHPFSSVNVYERAASGSAVEGYAAAVRCTDSASGEVVASGPAKGVTVHYDRARAVECRFTNVLVPAVIVRESLEPPTDVGRFDLLVNGALVQANAGDGALSEPRTVPVGTVTVSERAATGTSGGAYAASVECRRDEGAGDVVASAQGTGVRFPITAGDVVVCAFLNARESGPPTPPTPTPSPTPGPDPEPVPVESDDVDLHVSAAAVERVVRRGAPVRFRVRVTNLGPIAATDVRVVPVVLQRGRARSELRVSAPQQGGICVVVRRGGVCRVARIGARRSVQLLFEVRDASVGRVPMRVLATAAEPERTRASNVAGATAQVLAPLRQCAAFEAWPQEIQLGRSLVRVTARDGRGRALAGVRVTTSGGPASAPPVRTGMGGGATVPVLATRIGVVVLTGTTPAPAAGTCRTQLAVVVPIARGSG